MAAWHDSATIPNKITGDKTMMHGLETLFAGACLYWCLNSEIKNLKLEIRALKVKCNTQEMNLKKLFYLRDIESHTPDPSLSEEERMSYKQALEDEIRMLADANRFILNEKQ